MSNITRSNVSYALNQPLNLDAPYPIISKRAPTTADKAPIGQTWIFTTNNAVYFLTSIVNNSANWESVSGGAGSFTALTVNPGPTNLIGALTVSADGNQVHIADDLDDNTVVIGSITGASPMTIQGGTSGITLEPADTGTITLGTDSMTGSINIGVNTGAGQTVNINNIANAHTHINMGTTSTISEITMGNRMTASVVTIAGGNTGGITLNSGGNILLGVASATAASPTATVEIDQRVGAATFTGFTTAAAASQVFTITNSLAFTTSDIQVSVCNEGANDAQMTLQRTARSNGSFAVTLKNNGTQALNGNVSIFFWIWS